MELSTDDEKYGGWNQVEHMTYPAKEFNGQFFVELYIPARTAIVLKEGKIRKPAKLTKAKAEPADEEPKAAKKAPKAKAAKVKAEAPAEEPRPKTTHKRTTKKTEE